MASKYLIKSTSGVRGIVGKGINAALASNYGAAFAASLKKKNSKAPLVIGRDSRPSGAHLIEAFIAGAQSVGMDVVSLGIVPTPTVEMAITGLKAAGGVCVTASHNSAPWNALKFFNAKGEFIDQKQFEALEKALNELSEGKSPYVAHDKLGLRCSDDRWVKRHIAATLKAPGVSGAAVRHRKFKVVVDAVNGAGSDALPELLEKLGCKVTRINCTPNGIFPHTPEPTPDNLTQLARAVKRHKADIGLACDPDADRLAIVDEKGSPIGEELTLALAVRQVLIATKPTKPTVAINLSTSRVTSDAAKEMGAKVFLSRVGEANVVAEMKKRKALIGGEGNGGVIYGALHYGRDCLIGAALVLSLLARSKSTVSELVGTLSKYYTIKTKAPLPEDFDARLANFARDLKAESPELSIDDRDGVRFDFEFGWLLIRKSNTEPIYRIVAETDTEDQAKALIKKTRAVFKV